jgi:hypothetical protein
VSFVVSRARLAEDPDRVWIVCVWILGTLVAIAAHSLERRFVGGGGVPRGVVLTAWAGAACALLLFAVRNDWYGTVWVGFTLDRVAVGIVLASMLIYLTLSSARWSTSLLVVSSVVVALLGLAFLFETPYTFVANHDNSFTLEDLLAPSAGRMPGFDYVAQYTTLLGLPLAVVAGLAPALFAHSPQFFAVAWVVLLQILTFVIAITSAVRVAPRRLRWMMPAIVLPVAFLVGADGLLYYADLPLRFFLPTLMLGVVIALTLNWRSDSRYWWRTAVLGIVGGAAAFNNLDFGIPGLLAGGVVVVASAVTWRRRLIGSGIYVLASVAIPGVSVAAGALTGRSLHPDYLLFFVRSFGLEGFFSERMPFFGLHVSFVFLGLIAVAIGALGARSTVRRTAALYRAILFQGAWLVLSLVYFSSRSLTPTLVTGSCFLAAVLLALLLAAAFSSLRLVARSRPSMWTSAGVLTCIAAVLALAVPIAAWTNFPSVQSAAEKFARVGQPSADALVYLAPDPTVAVAKLADAHLIGILSVSGSTWQSRLGVRNVSLFVHPNYLELGDGAQMQCAYLEGLAGDLLLTTSNQAAVLDESGACADQLDFEGTRFVADEPVYGTDWVVVPRR